VSSSSSSSAAAAASSASIAGNLIAAQVVAANAAPMAVADRQPQQAVQQRGGSVEVSAETITKRMQVQRTSKGNVDVEGEF